MGKVYWDETRFKKSGERLDVVALGDSWFWYPVDNLLNPINSASGEPSILCFGANGATSTELSSGYYFDMFKSALRGYGTTAAVLVSAGGNDFAGFDDFQKILRPDCSKFKKPEDCFAEGQPGRLLGSVKQAYEKIITAAMVARPGVKILVHNYDYAIPTGKGFLGLGQWLKAPMDYCKVPDPTGLERGHIRRDFICMLIDAMGEMQDSLVKEFPEAVIRVKTAGTLKDNQWANELHPEIEGFEALGKKVFAPVLTPIVFPSTATPKIKAAAKPKTKTKTKAKALTTEVQ